MKLFGAFIDWHMIFIMSFCATGLIQVFYYLFFFARLSFYKQAVNPSLQTTPVSVIVCARDEAENIAGNLPGILVQHYPYEHEVIVVNDNSVDESKYILEEYRKKFNQLKIIELTQEAKLIPGKKFPLSMGIKSAAYPIVLLTDADCVPATENWIYSMMQRISEKKQIVLGYGAYHKKNGFLNKFIRWETFHTALQYMSYALAGIPYMGVGRNLSYNKDLFLLNKGFSSHNHIAGGDDDLFINMVATGKNTTVNTDKQSFTYSKPPANVKQWFRQKKRHYSTSKHYKPVHKFLLSIYSLSHFLFYSLFIATLFYDWQLAIIILGIRFFIQGIIFYKTTSKLDEKDLFPFFPLLDLLMVFYYLSFAPSLFRKNKTAWK